MSKSKRAATGERPPAPREKRKVFTAESGGLRTGWLLAVSLLSYAIVALATRYGLVRAFGALFDAWGIDAVSAALAPGWARALYVWHGSLATLAFALLTLALCRWLMGLWRIQKGTPSAKVAYGAALLGGCVALIVAALCLLPDSSRLEWPLTAPRLTWSLPVLCGISLAAVLAEETFTKRVLLDGLLDRWGHPWAELIACAAFFLMGGGIGGGVVGAVNVLLLGWLCCLLHERRGLWAAVGFRWAWSAVNAFLLGFGGGSASVYRLYGVSEVLMTGGDAGPACGLWTTLLFVGVIAWLMLTRHKQRG